MTIDQFFQAALVVISALAGMVIKGQNSRIIALFDEIHDLRSQFLSLKDRVLEHYRPHADTREAMRDAITLAIEPLKSEISNMRLQLSNMQSHHPRDPQS